MYIFQRLRGKRTTSVRANPPVEVEMLNVEPDHGSRVCIMILH